MIKLTMLAATLATTPVQDYLRNFSPDMAIIAEIESGFDPSAVSPVGAKGVMQLMPVAIAEVYQRGCQGRTLPVPFDVWNYRHNILVGVCYFDILRTVYRLDLRRAVAAYNLGPTRVHGPWPTETRNYVRKFYNIRERNIPCYNLLLSLPWQRLRCLPLRRQPVRY